MENEDLYFHIGKYIYSPDTMRKVFRIFDNYPTWTLPVIDALKRDDAHMFRDKEGKEVFYLINWVAYNQKLAIMLGLLETRNYTIHDALLQDVMKLFKNKYAIKLFLKKNTSLSYRRKKATLTGNELTRELNYRGFRPKASSDRRFEEHKYHIMASNEAGTEFAYPISMPDKDELRKLLYGKINIKGITHIKRR